MKLLRYGVPLLVGFLIQNGFAGGVDWKGQYRFEYFDISSTNLDNGGAKAAFLNRLNLRPHLIAGDGLRVMTNLEVLSNSLYPNDQVGAWFGSHVQIDQVHRRQQGVSQFTVREAYLRWEQEHAELIVGRAPFQFGLGAFYNAGLGSFDHFSDNYDMISYKIYVGNLLIQPILTTVQDESIQRSGGTNDQMIHLFYNNQDAGARFGVLYRNRIAPAVFAPVASRPAVYNESAVVGDYKVNNSHLYFAREWDTFAFRMEGGFESGSTGFQQGNGGSIDLGGYGVNLEFDYRPKDSNWDYRLLTGIVSGDDPKTARYEGFQLHRNYDIAFLLANHPLGKFDALSSYRQRSRDTSAPFSVKSNASVLDEEAVGNMVYLAPQFNKSLGDRWKWMNRIVLAQMQTNPSQQANVNAFLGWEYDFGLKFQPYDRFQWVTEIGLFMPGAAFSEGALQHPIRSIWGWQTRAAIDF